MKKIAFILGIILFIATSCKDEECEDIFKLADLVVSKVEQSSETEENETVYSIIHTVLNTLDDLVCTDGGKTADPHQTEIPIEYSPDGDFGSKSDIIQTKTVDAGSLAKGETYEVKSDIVFEVDGVYRIIANVDVNNDVEERFEKNNQSIDPITGSKNFIIINVKNTGRSFPEFDKNGKPMYIKRWDTEVK